MDKMKKKILGADILDLCMILNDSFSTTSWFKVFYLIRCLEFNIMVPIIFSYKSENMKLLKSHWLREQASS